MNPRSQNRSVKIDELPEIERQAMELARENIAAMERVIYPTLAQEVDRIWVAEMTRRGIPVEHVRKIREALPVVVRLQKLLQRTARVA